MQIINTIRGIEWWEYKIAPLLGISYFFIYKYDIGFIDGLINIAVILLSLIPGAIYVSVLNDITDIEIDILANKNNRMANLSITYRYTFLLVSLLCGFLSILLFYQNAYAIVFYFLSYFSFTLYSLKPFRFKERKILGTFADALGSQVFPSLFIACLMAPNLEHSFFELFVIAIWSLCFGLRGILWHQFSDLKNDIQSGITNTVSGWTKKNISRIEFIISFVEILSFLLLIYLTGFRGFILTFLIFIVYLFLLKYKFGAILILIKSPPNKNYSLPLNEFYQIFLPITLLSAISIEQALYLILFTIHLILFPTGVLNVFKCYRTAIFD